MIENAAASARKIARSGQGVVARRGRKANEQPRKGALGGIG
jgi:hypothetical protein